MSYDTRKSMSGQEHVEEIEMILDACKYTMGDYLTKNSIHFKSGQTILAGDTGNFLVDTVPVGWSALWGVGATVYGKSTVTNELFSFIIVSNSTVNITARGLGGTTANILSGNTVKLKHMGEGDGSCRGFPFGCSNTDSYSSTAKKSLIFSTGNNAGGLRRFPGLRKVTHDAGEVDPGESIGTRAHLRFDISNQIHNDFGIVPYADKQTSNGTMFGKLMARHPYFQGREILYREGYRDANTYQAPDFIERRFIIDTVNLTNGVFSVAALDPLILTEDKKAQMPVASPATLSIAINGASTSISYVNAASYYFGPMSSTIYVRIDSEIIECLVSGAATLSIVNRGYRSVIKDHDAAASIQDCIVFTGTHGINAILFALQNYTKIPSTYIDTYTAVIASLPAFILHKTVISKPMAVVDFINAMVQLGNLVFYYNEETQKIAIEYTPELLIQPITIEQKVDVKRDSVTLDNNVKNQWTRMAYLFNPVDLTKDTEENYAIRFLSANVALESGEYIGQVNEKKTIKNSMLDGSVGDSLLATSYVGRVLQNNTLTPKLINLTLEASKVGNVGAGKLGLGSVLNVSLTQNEDKDGNAIAELYQVLKLTGDGYAGFKTKLRRYQAIIPSTVNFTISASANNYVLSAHYAPASPGTYVVYIDPVVVFGSYDVTIPAFSTGVQAAGVKFKIVNRGKILGMGGKGGDSGLISLAPTAGQVGGIAFEAKVDCVIDNGAGLIWAGGGGGSGQPLTGSSGYYAAARGGTGAQGFGDSLGGQYSNGAFPGTPAFDGIENSGNQSSAGAGLQAGGEWGEDGTPSSSLAGGLAGEAVKSNGNSVTFSSGDNTLNVRGRRT